MRKPKKAPRSDELQQGDYQTKLNTNNTTTSAQRQTKPASLERVRDAIYRQIGLHFIRCCTGQPVTELERLKVDKAIERVKEIELALEVGE